MGISLDNHPHVKGVTPTVKIVNWEDYISLKIEIGDLRVTSYIYPLEGERIQDLIERVSAELARPVVTFPHDHFLRS